MIFVQLKQVISCECYENPDLASFVVSEYYFLYNNMLRA